MTSQIADEKKHVPLIEAPEEVIAGEPFEVKVIAGKTTDQVKGEQVNIELYIDEELVDKKELELSEGVTGSVFTAIGTEDMIAAREIRNCNIHGFGVCGTCGTRSAIVNLRARLSCKTHGSWEDTKGIEIISATTGSGKKCKWGPVL